MQFQQYIKVGDKPFTLAYGAKGWGVGAPLPPTKDDFATVVSEPGSGRDEFTRLLGINESVSIRGVIQYSDSYDGQYETGFCLDRLPTGAIMNCREGNYIK
jgi:hypothetical protein